MVIPYLILEVFMGEIIQIKVEKGGVGKTFIASNLAHLLALLDYKVIILSIDSQNNVYSIFNKVNQRIKGSLKKSILNDKISKIELRENLDFIPIELYLSPNILKEVPAFLRKLKKNYDYIIIDSLPALKVDNIFLENSDKIIIPAHGDKMTLQGIISIIKEHREKIHSIIFNKYINTKINKEYYKEIKEICKNSGIYISKPIKNNAFIAELIEKGKTIWESRAKKIIETQEIFKNIVRRF
ncbi:MULTISPECIES: ParA family protein [Fusobacterium]|uniref:ParA family protein n=1 Tax=Fusobacterium TaxID=848 RepID=UPI000C1C1E93|nr:ParA family protein [Fusobacterium pseudoperiodonticum]ATV64744.1 ATPase [Fusobacterium pseudoperiodonticum]MDU2234655.1 ParA family protein [Fusobacterium periodonticum]